jgi:hypothetical protein
LLHLPVLVHTKNANRRAKRSEQKSINSSNNTRPKQKRSFQTDSYHGSSLEQTNKTLTHFSKLGDTS